MRFRLSPLSADTPPVIKGLELIMGGSGALAFLVTASVAGHLPPSSTDPIWWRPLLALFAISAGLVLLWGLYVFASALWHVARPERKATGALATSPPSPENPLFVAEEGAKVSLKNTVASGFDGPKLTKKAEWSTERTWLQHSEESVPIGEALDRILGPSRVIPPEVGALQLDATSSTRDESGVRGTNGDVLTDKGAIFGDSEADGPPSDV